MDGEGLLPMTLLSPMSESDASDRSYLKTAYTKDRPVLVAYDTAFEKSPVLHAAEVLAEAGWTVKLPRDCPHW